ncbi:MAG: tyrosine-type recombinase/integrase [Bacilli bacterium]|nr:tyrosine-type recombinase/integrase [Bacilli bacterium]
MASINIRKRGNVYQYSFEVGKVNGKRKQMTKSGFRTKAEAQASGTKAYNDYLNTGLAFKEKEISYSEYLDYWIENHCEMNLKYNTIQTYKIIIDKYLKPNLGHYRLGAITSVRLTSFINDIVKQNNFSRAYFKNILKVVKGSFRDACSVFGFINNNPAMIVRLPKIEEKREDIKHVYTQDEIDRILLRFKDDDTFTCAFLTSCYTGMRTSEVFALTWEDIDFENRIIKVRHSIYDKNKDYKGRWYIGSTKTINGVRNINICNTLFNALLSYKKKQDKLKKIYGTKYFYYHVEKVLNEYGKVKEYRIVENEIDMNYSNNINLIFTKKDGKYSGTDITKYPYSIIHHELGIEKCRFYDLRGSYATKTLKSGVEIRDVADILGHKNVETTENYYISSSHDSRKEATDIFEKTTQSSVISSISNYDIKI